MECSGIEKILKLHLIFMIFLRNVLIISLKAVTKKNIDRMFYRIQTLFENRTPLRMANRTPPHRTPTHRKIGSPHRTPTQRTPKRRAPLRRFSLKKLKTQFIKNVL